MKDKSKLNIVFVGHFTPLTASINNIHSAAGSLTQQEIINSLTNNKQVNCFDSFIMATNPSWPKGPLWSKGYRLNNLRVIGCLNIFFVRNIWFSLRLLIFLLRRKPNLCVHYNSYFFENLSMLLYKFFNRKSKLAVIIQDIKVSKNDSITNLIEKSGIALVKKFDILIPITNEIIEDFGFDKQKSFVFQGGVTGKALFNQQDFIKENLQNIAVFAGALEYYNGIDILVKRWKEARINTELHIFGNGSLTDMIQDYASKSDNIVFHGFCSEEDVILLQSNARWLISLRYSKGLNQNYFFPSKFFNLLALPGNVLVNNFNNIPKLLFPYLVFVDDDLKSLDNALLVESDSNSPQKLHERHTILREKCSWNSMVSEMIYRSTGALT